MAPKHLPQQPTINASKREAPDPLSSTCTGSLSALVKGAEFFALLKVLRCSAAAPGVPRASALPGAPNQEKSL